MHLAPRLFCSSRVRNKGKYKWELTSDGGLIYCWIDYSSPSPEEPPRVRSLAVISPHGRNPVVWAEKENEAKKKTKPLLLLSVVKELAGRFAMEIRGVRFGLLSLVQAVLESHLERSWNPGDEINAKKNRMLAVLIHGIDVARKTKVAVLNGKELERLGFFSWFLPAILIYCSKAHEYCRI